MEDRLEPAREITPIYALVQPRDGKRETIHPRSPLLVRGSLSYSCSFSLYFAVIASSYGNLPESIFYTSRVFFSLNLLLGMVDMAGC